MHKSEKSARGDRFQAMLRKTGFGGRHGSVKALMSFLRENDKDTFDAIKYTTVKSWFSGSMPRGEKSHALLRCLATQYDVPEGITEIRAWWDSGVGEPFGASHADLDEHEAAKRWQTLLGLAHLSDNDTARRLACVTVLSISNREARRRCQTGVLSVNRTTLTKEVTTLLKEVHEQGGDNHLEKAEAYVDWLTKKTPAPFQEDTSKIRTSVANEIKSLAFAVALVTLKKDPRLVTQNITQVQLDKLVNVAELCNIDLEEDYALLIRLRDSEQFMGVLSAMLETTDQALI